MKKNVRFLTKKRAILIFFVLICNLYQQALFAQNDMQLTGVANLPTSMNPGAAGQSGAIKAVVAYKKQWVGVSGSPSTTLLGIDAEVKFLHNFHGVGVMVFYDQIGPLTNMNINANYSFHVELDKGLLGIGARIGALNISMKTSDLFTSVGGYDNDYHQSSDPLLQSEDQSGTALDIGLGAFYQTRKGYLSLSFLHLTAPTIETKDLVEIKNKPLMTLGGGRMLGSGETLFEPRVFFKTDFASWQLEFSGQLDIRKHVSLGLGYRIQDALFFQLGLSLFNGLFIGYSYDLSLSKVIRYSSGSHEIAVSYTFNVDVEKRNKRYKSVRIL